MKIEEDEEHSIFINMFGLQQLPDRLSRELDFTFYKLYSLQSLYTGVRSAVPFQQNPVSMETEYQCSYQYIEPPAGPRLRKHVEQPAPIFHTYRVLMCVCVCV